MIYIFSYNYFHDYSHFNSDNSVLRSAMDLEVRVETHSSSQFIEKITQHHTSTNSAILSSPLFKP